ncbi:MAG: AAA family ATPase [bacterium]|nr:AAA family ATPase [bacterium]
MNLVSFSVTNFRSITKAHKVPIKQMAVLIGKNNEGKSNLLKALNIAMTYLESFGEDSRRPTRLYHSRYDNYDRYRWDRDFPISLQSRTKNTDSIFRLEFELNESEIADFKDEIKSNLNGTLPIELKIGKNRVPKVTVIKKGKGSATLNSKSKKIASYISQRINFNYIPAIRTDKEAMRVVDELLSKELGTLESMDEYNNALKTISDLQKPILEELSENIKTSLCELLPQVKNVEIETQESRRRMALRQEFEIMIDDGNRTSLEFKGDGVKSLAALGLLKDMKNKDGVVSVIAIEEPESHLHPGAIHILKDTIYALADENQVILSTHNPLFIDRKNLSSNIIINSGKVNTAKNIKEIRELIGVKASDNLQHANYVLVVEGEEDVRALNALLPVLSDKIKKALSNDTFIIEKIGGAGNLSYRLNRLKNTLCLYHVLLDNDDAGRKAEQKATSQKELEIANLTYVNCPGMNDSEFEDCLNLETYKEHIESSYGIIFSVPQFRNNTKKWSDRMKDVFQTQGKPWNDNIEAELKEQVAICVEKNPNNCINEHKKGSIDSLVRNLEKMIK